MAFPLGCIADDYTGAADVACSLQRVGLRTTLLFGLPDDGPVPPRRDAVVVALKTRNLPPAAAVRQSSAALAWLRVAGARQIYFKYCSTFDSTPRGNIGPVAEAMMEELDTSLTVVCPAAPEQGRTVYQGHLFVGDQLLSESSMRHHPLTPMTDSSLRRLLAAQTSGDVAVVPHHVVAAGAGAVGDALAELARRGVRFAVADAIDEQSLDTLGQACGGMALVTGAVGLARGLARQYAQRTAAEPAKDLRGEVEGAELVLAGSCSARTLEQVEHMRASRPAFHVDADALSAGGDGVSAAVSWADDHMGSGPVLVYSSITPEQLRAVQSSRDADEVAELVESSMGEIALRLVDRGVRRILVAGGETTGAVLAALGVHGVDVGPEVDPGVPWTFSHGKPRLALMPKSGNFGRPDLFTRAFEALR